MTRTGALEGQLGMDAALERDATGEWTAKARRWITARAAFGLLPAAFTSDDIRRACGNPPGSGNILGALLSQEVRAGRIEVVGRRKSTRPDRHRARLNVYRGRTA